VECFQNTVTGKILYERPASAITGFHTAADQLAMNAAHAAMMGQQTEKLVEATRLRQEAMAQALKLKEHQM
jgi:hypothetical protein